MNDTHEGPAYTEAGIPVVGQTQTDLAVSSISSESYSFSEHLRKHRSSYINFFDQWLIEAERNDKTEKILREEIEKSNLECEELKNILKRRNQENDELAKRMKKSDDTLIGLKTEKDEMKLLYDNINAMCSKNAKVLADLTPGAEICAQKSTESAPDYMNRMIKIRAKQLKHFMNASRLCFDETVSKGHHK